MRPLLFFTLPQGATHAPGVTAADCCEIPNLAGSDVPENQRLEMRAAGHLDHRSRGQGRIPGPPAVAEFWRDRKLALFPVLPPASERAAAKP
jgi:hypothetical protein